ncbi:hypothetical protein [Nocardioides convexus]|uniref:hypothetical protein n=1 Tax=Nocardioides convexus TaxID=2712224 RepID=UPI0024189A33|nr:hypothetical protein [Nocardioides convexus]
MTDQHPSLTYSSLSRPRRRPRRAAPPLRRARRAPLHRDPPGLRACGSSRCCTSLTGLQDRLEAGDTPRALQTLGRVRAILKVAVAQVDVLETMTPRQFSRLPRPPRRLQRLPVRAVP